jgi:hypothetical protein
MSSPLLGLDANQAKFFQKNFPFDKRGCSVVKDDTISDFSNCPAGRDEYFLEDVTSKICPGFDQHFIGLESDVPVNI